MDTKRNILAVLLIGIIIILTPYYMSLFEPVGTEKPTNTLPNNSSETKITPDDYAQTTLNNPINISREKIIYIETDLYIAAISNQSGGSFKEFRLKKYLGGFNVEDKYDPYSYVSLIPNTSNACSPCLTMKKNTQINSYIFNDYFTSAFIDGDTIFIAPDDVYTLDFTYNHTDGFTITKSVEFAGNSYLTNQYIEFIADDFNYSDVLQLSWDEGLLPTELIEMDDIQNAGVVINQAGEIENFHHTDNTEIPETVLRGNTNWIALKSKYFIAAIIPESTGTYGSYSYKNILFNDREITPKYSMSVGFPSANSVNLNFGLYLGPLDYNILSQYGIGLENALSLGWQFIRPFSKLVLKLLEFLHRFLNNYGLVLIVFALLIRIITGPLTKKSAMSSQKMQKIQPIIKKVQEKYKNDPQKRNQETIALYKKHEVNPLGGCLPILIQMPLLFALFTVFRTTIEFRGAEFFWWIKDLSQPDAIFQLPFSIPLYGDSVCVLPVFMGVTMFFQQRTSMATMDKSQKVPMYFMSAFFFLLFNQFPSGLNLYYSVSNVLNIIQQRSIRKNVTAKKSA